MAGTFSKAPRAWGFDRFHIAGIQRDITPTMHLRGNNGNIYLDWVCGLGAVLMGYGDNRIGGFTSHVTQQIIDGVGFSIVHQLEYKVAELLATMLGDNIPGWSPDDISVRFGKTGSDACSMAVRLARAITGKDVIISYGYHGWGEDFISAEPPAHGIPVDYKRDCVRKIKYNNLTSIRQAIRHGGVACIIVEHPPQDPEDWWYPRLRETCDELGALLIIDEVVTGLRYSLGGVCDIFEIEPDIVCMGKGMGNGFPISAVVGRREYMDWFARTDPVFCSSTHWGETASLSAAEYVLTHWTEDDICHLYDIGELLLNGMNKAGWKTTGDAPRSILHFEDDYERAFFIQGMMQFNILMNRPNFPALAHTNENVFKTIAIASELRRQYDNSDKEALKIALEPYLPHVLFSNR